MSFDVATVLSLVIAYKYWILFPVAVIEGPIVTVIAGFLAQQGELSLIVAFIILVTADLVGDVAYYCIGRYGRHRFIDRWGKYVGINVKELDKIEKHFDSHSGKTLVFGKLTHVTGMPILVASGIARVPFARFVYFNLLATLPKTAVFLVIGYYFGSASEAIDRYLGRFYTIGALVVVVLAVAGFLYYKHRQKVKTP